MAYGLDLRLFVENGPAAQSAIVRGQSSGRIAAGLRREPPPPANDQQPAFPDGYPVAL